MPIKKIPISSNRLLGLFLLCCLSAATIYLQYAEAVENDGLTLCLDDGTGMDSCQHSHKSNDDNDNEMTSQTLVYEVHRSLHLVITGPIHFEVSLPSHSDQYDHLFISELIKPPIKV
jgi:hypothetical protein